MSNGDDRDTMGGRVVRGSLTHQSWFEPGNLDIDRSRQADEAGLAAWFGHCYCMIVKWSQENWSYVRHFLCWLSVPVQASMLGEPADCSPWRTSLHSIGPLSFSGLNEECTHTNP